MFVIGYKHKKRLKCPYYIAGAINREIQDKKGAGEYKKLIAHREIEVEKWPKI